MASRPAPTFAPPRRTVYLDAVVDQIKNRKVIPILGPELMSVPYRGRDVTMDQYLAHRLAESLDIPEAALPADVTLSWVAARNGQQMRDVVYFLHRLLRDETFPTPAPLKKLASIRPFSLFVTTTFDGLVEQAVNEVRRGGPRARVHTYAPTRELEDLDPGAALTGAPAVYHLFGRASPIAREFVVTEEDTLDFVHALHSAKRPSRLFEEMDRNDLLFIGCRFPDWLARFVLRIARKERLSRREQVMEIVADRWALQDESLTLFLGQFSSSTRVFSGDAVNFVDALFELWERRYPGDVIRPDDADRQQEQDEQDGWSPGMVFLSYARDDDERAHRLYDALTLGGMDVWMDARRLQGGERWSDKIRRNINECSVFVPVLSRRAAAREPEAYVRQEWAQALARVRSDRGPAPAIVPVVVDDLPDGAGGTPPEFWELQAERARDGHVTLPLGQRVRDLQRRFRDPRGARP